MCYLSVGFGRLTEKKKNGAFFGGFENKSQKMKRYCQPQLNYHYQPLPHHCYHEIERDHMFDSYQKVAQQLDLKRKECEKLTAEIVDLQWEICTLLPAPKPLVVIRPKLVAVHSEEDKQNLARIFSSLHSLEDIANLQRVPNAQTLATNEKFQRLWRIAPAVEHLNKMIGLRDIKKQIFTMLSYYSQIRPADELMHIVIDGPPGVGKTELAERLGQVLLKLQLFGKEGSYVHAQRSDLIGGYLGQTAPLTQKTIDKADAGVLFIDEAYGLGHSEQRDMYSKECIDTLTLNLTKKRGQFICIVAGYAEQLESCFFAANPGLESRFPMAFRMTLQPYTSIELCDILCQKMEACDWKSNIARKDMEKVFDRYLHQMTAFARDVQTCWTQTKMVALCRILRTSLCFNAKPDLTLQDLEQACSVCFQRKKPTDRSMMYV